MTKSELIRRAAVYLKEKGVRKPVSMPKQKFFVSDEEGNSKAFTIKQTEKTVMYNIDDITAMVDACIEIMEDALKNGEEIYIKGFGTLKLHLRKARWTYNPQTKEPIDVVARYLPKFTFGKELRMCAKLYELSLGNNDVNINEEPVQDEEGEE